MNSEDKKDDAKAIVSESQQGLATRPSSLISRGLRDVTAATDSKLVELGKALTSELQLDAVLHTIMDKINEELRPHTWSLLLLDQVEEELYFQIATGQGAEALKDVRVKLGQGIAGWVAQTGEAVVVPDTSRDHRFSPEVDGGAHMETRSIVAVPVKFRDTVCGVIELINYVDAGFSKRDLAVLDAIADFAAIAIENARHVQRIHELTITDDCTTLYNARHLNFMLDTELYRSQRYSFEFSLILADLNVEFEKVPVGAWFSCLAQVGEMLKSKCRLIDLTFYCGDTRFALLLPQTSKVNGCEFARKLSNLFQTAECLRYGGRIVKLPASIGVVSYPKDATTKAELWRIAHETMSLVKTRGRGGVAAANMGILQPADV